MFLFRLKIRASRRSRQIFMGLSNFLNEDGTVVEISDTSEAMIESNVYKLVIKCDREHCNCLSKVKIRLKLIQKL